MMNSDDVNDDLVTPKSTRARISATSTVDRCKPLRQNYNQSLESDLRNSLGILSLTNVDTSNICVARNESCSDILKQQRMLANNTLDRANKVASIPSRLLRPGQVDTFADTNEIISSESTVNESDLLNTPKNTSTPKSSLAHESAKRPAAVKLRDSISHFTQMLDSNMSIQSVAEKFLHIAQNSNSSKTSISTEVDSDMFVPGEEAASKILADEMSWKNKHDLPVTSVYSNFEDDKHQRSMSIGEFFQQRSDKITDLRSESPKKCEPLVLIDSNILDDTENQSSARNSMKSLSISAIQQLLSETERTPNKVIDYLLKQKERKSTKDIPTVHKNLSGDIYSLPVGGNSSYTTAFSDNEAVRAIVDNKENVSPSAEIKETTPRYTTATFQNSGDMKTMSPPSRSCSTLSSLPNGKLPIESTKSELVWGSVKVDRCVTKEFLLRNKTPKTLRLQCSLSSYEFKIRKDSRSDSDFLSTCKFVLHGHESRQLIVSYIPTKIGSAVDELSFTPLDSNLTQTKKQCVKLWGYGGYGNVEYQNAVRDNTGKYWLSLGRLDNKVVMEQCFTIKNTGNLPSFSYIKLIPKSIVTCSNLKLEPDLFVLLPNEEKSVKVSYTPSAKDARILKQSLNAISVVDIGRLEIIFGSEASRARLRRLFRKAEDKGLKTDEVSAVLRRRIPGEVFPADTNKFKESPDAIGDLLETFTRDEIALTIEQDPNQTIVAEYPEDSALFQTICHESTLMVNETQGCQPSCRLEPPSIILSPPNKIEDCLYLVSDFSKSVPFDVSSSHAGIQVVPARGILQPGQTFVLKVKLTKRTRETIFKVIVYVENEVLESEVKLLQVKSSFLE